MWNYPPPPCLICKKRVERAQPDGERCRKLIERVDAQLKRAPSLDRKTLETLLTIRKHLSTVMAGKACWGCSSRTENWASMTTTPTVYKLASEMDVPTSSR